ncbi:MAG: SpoIIE family protein phosphatase [bacterium]
MMRTRQMAIAVAVVLGALLALQVFQRGYTNIHVRQLFDVFALAFAMVLVGRIAPARTLRGEMGRLAFGVLFFALLQTIVSVLSAQIAIDLVIAGRIGWLLLTRVVLAIGIAWNLWSVIRLGGSLWMRRRRRVVIAFVLTAALAFFESPPLLIWIAGLYVILVAVPLGWMDELTGKWGWSAIGLLVMAPLAMIVFAAHTQMTYPENVVTSIIPSGVSDLNDLVYSPLFIIVQRYLALYWVMVPLRIAAAFFQGNFGLRIPISLKLALTYMFSTIIPGILLLLLLALTVYLGIGTMRARMVRNLIYDDLEGLETALFQRRIDTFAPADSVAAGFYSRVLIEQAEKVPPPPTPKSIPTGGITMQGASGEIPLATTQAEPEGLSVRDTTSTAPREVWVLLSRSPALWALPDTLPAFPGWSDTTMARHGILPMGNGRTAYAAALMRIPGSSIVNVALRPLNERTLKEYSSLVGVEVKVTPYSSLSIGRTNTGDVRAEFSEFEDPLWRNMQAIKTFTSETEDLFHRHLYHGFTELQSWPRSDGVSTQTLGLITVSTSLAGLFGSLYTASGVNYVTLLVILVLGIMFLLAVIFSSVLGFGITRTITSSVTSLRTGTERLRRGDLDTVIEVRSRDELGELAASFNRMTADLKRMIIEVGEKERLEREIQIARQIQLQLLPSTLPSTDRLTIAARSDPALEVGGDYYDAFQIEDQGIMLALGDVSGKGVGAAILMSNLQANLHVLSMQKISLSAVTAELNRQIWRNSTPEMFITCFLAKIDCVTMTMSYVNAGHDTPILLRDGRVEKLSTGGLLLGVKPNATYEEGSVLLKNGDLLGIYSDGLTEAMDEKDFEFGSQRIIDVLKRRRDEDPWVIVDSVLREVRSYAGDERAAQDDLTLMIVKVADNQSSSDE